jgi:MFS family permease
LLGHHGEGPARRANSDTVAPTAASERTPTSTRWVVLLLSLVLLINFVDRGALATAGPLIRHDLGLTFGQLGLLFSVFFWTYSFAQMPIGWLAERWGAHRVLAAGLAVWATATALTGVSSGFAVLVGLRLLLGLGESAGFPTVSSLLATVIPAKKLGQANGVVALGYLIGPGAGVWLAAMLIERVGWRGTFLVFGVGSLLWLVPWLCVRLPKLAAVPGDPGAPTVAALLRQRAFWGTSLGLFSLNYVSYFILSWLPGYLVAERGFSMSAMEHTATAGYLVSGLSAFVTGWGVDRYVASGGSANVGYKSILIVAHAGSVLCMLAMGFGADSLGIAGLFGFQILIGAAAPCIFVMSQILAGPRGSARWVGIQNAIGNLPGTLSPWVTGIIVDRTGHFALAFVAAAVMSALGIIGWLGMVPRLGPLKWSGVAPPAQERMSS